MLTTLCKLVTYLQDPKNGPHIFKKGRSATFKILDAVTEGFAKMFLTADICTIPRDEAGRREVFATGDDVGVN
jgi:hypothetical protein